MKGELAAFVDTSVLVQAVCADQPAKQRAAKAIVERGFVEACFATSTQVLVEVYDVLTRRAETPLSPMEGADRALTPRPLSPGLPPVRRERGGRSSGLRFPGMNAWATLPRPYGA